MLSLKNAGPSMLWLQSITNPHYIYTPHINWKSFSPLKIATGSFVFVTSSQWYGINKHFIHEIAEKSLHKKQSFEGKTTQRRTPCHSEFYPRETETETETDSHRETETEGDRENKTTMLQLCLPSSCDKNLEIRM